MLSPYDLNYEVAGDRRAPAILLLHGFMGSSADWRDAMAAIWDRVYCIAPDLPGRGASLKLTSEAYTIEGSARAAIQVLDRLEVQNPVVVGYSMGGRLALYLALRYPERCAGLFLESASPSLESIEEQSARRTTDGKRARRLESGDLEGFLQEWYRQPLFAPLARDEGLLSRIIRARRRNDPVELARSLRGIGTGNQPSLWGELKGLAVPTLAVAGELDEKYAAIASRMSGISPMVEPISIPRVGHDVHDEAPGEYAALLRRFLGELALALGEAEPVS